MLRTISEHVGAVPKNISSGISHSLEHSVVTDAKQLLNFFAARSLRNVFSSSMFSRLVWIGQLVLHSYYPKTNLLEKHNSSFIAFELGLSCLMGIAFPVWRAKNYRGDKAWVSAYTLMLHDKSSKLPQKYRLRRRLILRLTKCIMGCRFYSSGNDPLWYIDSL